MQKKAGINILPQEDDVQPQWEEILEAACNTDPYLSLHFNDIRLLLKFIIEILNKSDQEMSDMLGTRMRNILDKSSVTGISTEIKTEDLDNKKLIHKLHKNIIARFKEKLPETRIQMKRNTGNGGFYIWYNNNKRFDITFTPSVNKENKISLKVNLAFHFRRPERLIGKTFDEIMENEKISSEIRRLDTVISPLLNSWFFKGKTYEGTTTYFSSYVDELRFIHNKGWLERDITNNPQYWIVLDKPSHFEEKTIVDSIVKLLIANHDFRKNMEIILSTYNN